MVTALSLPVSGAQDRNRTCTGCPTATSRLRVCQIPPPEHLVPETGIEPARDFSPTDLNRRRLPNSATPANCLGSLGGSRTLTPFLRATDFESVAAASYATRPFSGGQSQGRTEFWGFSVPRDDRTRSLPILWWQRWGSNPLTATPVHPLITRGRFTVC